LYKTGVRDVAIERSDELSAAQTRMGGGCEGEEIFLLEPNSSGAPMHLDSTVFGGCVRIVPVHLLRLLHTSTMASGRATPQTVINRHFTRLAASDKARQRPMSESALPKQAFPSICVGMMQA
jgi:hypothetical protein